MSTLNEPIPLPHKWGRPLGELSLDEMGVVPVDPELAQQLLWLPEP